MKTSPELAEFYKRTLIKTIVKYIFPDNESPFERMYRELVDNTVRKNRVIRIFITKHPELENLPEIKNIEETAEYKRRVNGDFSQQ